MRVAVPKETAPGERRVALVPETVSKLRDAGFEVRVERGAGASCRVLGRRVRAAGAELADAGSLSTGAEAVVCVGVALGRGRGVARARARSSSASSSR